MSKYYTQAIYLDPSKAGLYVNRASTNIKFENYTDAILDANKAIESDPSLVKAYLHKGMAYSFMEEYHTTMVAFKAGSTLDANHTEFKT